MATERVPEVLQGFLVPLLLDESNLWSAHSSFDQRSPIPGQAVPLDSSTALSLRTSGTMEAGESVRVRVQRAGDPGPGGAQAVWKNTDDGDEQWRGHDSLAISGWESLIWTDGSGLTTAAIDPHILALPDGRIALVWQETSSLPLYAVRVRVRETDGTWGSALTLATTTALPTGGFYPCLCLEPDEAALLVAHWDAEEAGQVRLHRAKLSDLTTWTVAAKGALQEPIDTATYTPGRLRLAALPGQYLMLAEMSDATATSWDNLHIQWGALGGMRFYEIERGDGSASGIPFGAPDLVAHDGVFVVTYIVAVTETHCKRLGNAFESLAAAPAVTLQTGFDTATAVGTVYVHVENTLWVGDDGALFAAGMDAPNGWCWMKTSTDGGATWADICSLRPLWYISTDVNTRPRRISGCMQRGRHVLAHNHRADPGNEDDSLSIVYVGGFTTVTLDHYLSDAQQVPWSGTWLPFDEPQDGRWDGNGAGAETLTDGFLELDGSGGALQRYYGRATHPPSGGVDDGLAIRATVRCRALGAIATEACAIRLTLGDGSEGYQASIRFQNNPPRIAVYDGVAGTQIGSTIVLTDWTRPVQVLATIRGSRFALWYRTATTSEDRVWTAGPASSSLNDAGGAAAADNDIEWGHITSTQAESEWSEFHFINTTGTLLAGIDPGFNNPADLRGKDLARRGHGGASGGGLRIEADTGPAREGDEFQVDADYQFPIRRVFADISRGSTAPWRTDGTDPATPEAAQTIALALNPDDPGDEEEPFPSDVLGLYLGGANWGSGTLKGRDVDTGSWVNLATFDTAITINNVTRRGRMLIPGNTADAPYLHHHECAGWTAVLNGTTLRRVKTNTAGKCTVTSGKQALIELEDIAGTEPTSGITLRLVPTAAVILVHLLGARYSAFQLTISSQRTLTGYLETAQAWLGPVHLFGQEHSWGREQETRPQVATRKRLDGLTRARRLGRALRRWRFGWVDGTVNLSDLWGTNPDPAFIKASTNPAAVAVAAEMDIPYLLEGLLRQVDGEMRPLVYIPGFLQGAATTLVLSRRQQFIASELTSAVSWDQILGNENQGSIGEQVRVAVITGEEVP